MEDEPLAQGYTIQNNQISPKKLVLIIKTHPKTLFKTPQTHLKQREGGGWEAAVNMTWSQM